MPVSNEVPKTAVTSKISEKINSGNLINISISDISTRFPKCRFSHYIYRITDVLGTSSRALLSIIAYYCDTAAGVHLFTHVWRCEAFCLSEGHPAVMPNPISRVPKVQSRRQSFRFTQHGSDKTCETPCRCGDMTCWRVRALKMRF